VRVVGGDLAAENGVIHAIDNVLVTDDVRGLLNAQQGG